MMKRALFVLPVFFCLFSCSDGLGWNGSSSGTARVDKSKRTAIDDTKYVDFTIPANDAKQVAKNGFLTECNGRFVNGTSAITFNAAAGTVTMSTDRAFIDGKENQQFYAKFSFDVDGAGSNCLYIRQKDKSQGTAIINGVSFNTFAVPDLLVCIPLYGYSPKRLEVSPVMKGFAAMPAGTYWKETESQK